MKIANLHAIEVSWIGQRDSGPTEPGDRKLAVSFRTNAYDNGVQANACQAHAVAWLTIAELEGLIVEAQRELEKAKRPCPACGRPAQEAPK